MFDFDASKLLIIGMIALVVIGPKDLPRVLRQFGQWTGKMRRMANEFRGQFMDAMREADFESIKKEVDAAAAAAEIPHDFDPIGDVDREIRSAMAGAPVADATPATLEHSVALPTAPVETLPISGDETPRSPIPAYLTGATAEDASAASVGRAVARERSDQEDDVAGNEGIVLPPLSSRSMSYPQPSGESATSRSARIYKSSRADAVAARALRRTDRAREMAKAAIGRRPPAGASMEGQGAPDPRRQV